MFKLLVVPSHFRSPYSGTRLVKYVLRFVTGPPLYSEYTAHVESIWVLRVFAVPTNKILTVLAVPAVHYPEILDVQGVSTAVPNPEILLSPELSVVLNPEIL